MTNEKAIEVLENLIITLKKTIVIYKDDLLIPKSTRNDLITLYCDRIKAIEISIAVLKKEVPETKQDISAHLRF